MKKWKKVRDKMERENVKIFLLILEIIINEANTRKIGSNRFQ